MSVGQRAWKSFMDAGSFRAIKVDTMPGSHRPFIIVDVETTGLDPGTAENPRDQIVQIGMVLYQKYQEVDHYQAMVKPGAEFHKKAIEVHGITAPMVRHKPPFNQIADDIVAFLSKAPVISAYNLPFDHRFLSVECERAQAPLPEKVQFDILPMMRRIYKNRLRRFDLESVARHLKMLDETQRQIHRAIDDARLAGKCLIHLLKQMPPDTYPDALRPGNHSVAQRQASRRPAWT